MKYKVDISGSAPASATVKIDAPNEAAARKQVEEIQSALLGEECSDEAEEIVSGLIWEVDEVDQSDAKAYLIQAPKKPKPKKRTS